jgi:hypothetical protein
LGFVLFRWIKSNKKRRQAAALQGEASAVAI